MQNGFIQTGLLSKLRKNSGFVSGYRFSDTASASKSVAPLGAGSRVSTFSATSSHELSKGSGQLPRFGMLVGIFLAQTVRGFEHVSWHSNSRLAQDLHVAAASRLRWRLRFRRSPRQGQGQGQGQSEKTGEARDRCARRHLSGDLTRGDLRSAGTERRGQVD